MKTGSITVAIVLSLFMTAASASGQAAVSAVLQPSTQRRPAPELNLRDSSGHVVSLKSYRGKVVVLDFWATWCHGCKEEIPWFAEFQRKYGAQGVNVVGVSLDDEGWKVVKPFIKSAGIPYTIILGDQATAKEYGIESMPDTFLIDRQGRIAAKYSGIVSRDDIDANLRSLLAEK